MAPLSPALLLMLVGLALGTVLRVDAATKVPAAKPPCNTRTACYPFAANGLPCDRSGRMNLRLVLQLSPEERLSNVSAVTYAMCPYVDEFQALNLSNALRLAGTSRTTIRDPLTSQQLNVTQVSPTVQASFLSIYGMTNSSNRTLPELGSFGSVMIIDNITDACPLGAVGAVNFLILNFTLRNGKYVYDAGLPTPVGSGFKFTCDSSDVCLLDPTLKCFGLRLGERNCGQCVSNGDDLGAMKLQVWTSYYGTDSQGRNLRSGGTNPLNYRAFSGGGLFASMRRTYGDLRDGDQVTEEDVQS
jgi:hypothetical protein